MLGEPREEERFCLVGKRAGEGGIRMGLYVNSRVCTLRREKGVLDTRYIQTKSWKFEAGNCSLLWTCWLIWKLYGRLSAEGKNREYEVFSNYESGGRNANNVKDALEVMQEGQR